MANGANGVVFPAAVKLVEKGYKLDTGK